MFLNFTFIVLQLKITDYADMFTKNKLETATAK